MYLFYRHRGDAARELVLADGASFPRHLNRDEWYLHGNHASVNGRTGSDIATLGFCDRNGGATFGRRITGAPRASLMRSSRL